MVSNKVSVVIPVYNVEKYLRECVDSVLIQSYTDLEIILVDDGATDSSGKICDEYVATDKRVKVIHKENGGLSSARNIGLDSSTGQYVYFLDSDDYIEPNTIKVLINTIRESEADFVFFDGHIFYEDSVDIRPTNNYIREKRYETCKGKEQLKKLLDADEYRTAVPFMFFKKTFLDKNELKFKEGIIHEDELFTIMVFMTDAIVSHCHQALYHYRIRPNSIMTTPKAIKSYESMVVIFDELVENYGKRTFSGNVAKLCMIRMAKTLMGRYALLPNEKKMEYEISYTKFKKQVMKYNGFGDQKLKIKCSGKLMSYWYRIEAKIKR